MSVTTRFVPISERQKSAADTAARLEAEIESHREAITAREQALEKTRAELAGHDAWAAEVQEFAKKQGLPEALAESELRRIRGEDQGPQDTLSMSPAQYRMYKARMHGLGSGY